MKSKLNLKQKKNNKEYKSIKHTIEDRGEKIKSFLFKKMNKTDKPLARLVSKERSQKTLRNEKLAGLHFLQI